VKKNLAPPRFWEFAVADCQTEGFLRAQYAEHDESEEHDQAAAARTLVSADIGEGNQQFYALGRANTTAESTETTAFEGFFSVLFSLSSAWKSSTPSVTRYVR
jgi:hypothetical protein